MTHFRQAPSLPSAISAPDLNPLAPSPCDGRAPSTPPAAPRHGLVQGPRGQPIARRMDFPPLSPRGGAAPLHPLGETARSRRQPGCERLTAGLSPLQGPRCAARHGPSLSAQSDPCLRCSRPDRGGWRPERSRRTVSRSSRSSRTFFRSPHPDHTFTHCFFRSSSVIMSLLPENFVPDTWGANLVGTMLSCTSYGVLLAVAWSYFSRFPSDRWAYRLLAVLMLLIGTADTIISKPFPVGPRQRPVADPAASRLPLHLHGPNYELRLRAAHPPRELELSVQHHPHRSHLRRAPELYVVQDLDRDGAAVAGLPGLVGCAVARGVCDCGLVSRGPGLVR